MLADQGGKSAELGAAKAATVVQANGVEPELGPALVALYVNMRRLAAFLGVEEEAVGADTQDRRHPERCRPQGGSGKRSVGDSRGSFHVRCSPIRCVVNAGRVPLNDLRLSCAAFQQSAGAHSAPAPSE